MLKITGFVLTIVIVIAFNFTGCSRPTASTENTTIMSVEPSPATSTPSIKATSVPTPPEVSWPSPTATLPPGQEPIQILSWAFPLGHINPGGPYMEITIKNIWIEPVIFLTVTFQGKGIADNPMFPGNKVLVNFFDGLPLLPGKIYTQGKIILGPLGPTLDNPNSVTINGTLQSNVAFTYTKSVQITRTAE